jgi:hypothetical protein
MRIALALRSVAARGGKRIRRRTGWRSQRPQLVPLFGIVVGTLALAGCGSEYGAYEARQRLPASKAALLKRLPPPNCEYRVASLDPEKRQPDGQAATAADPDQGLRAKLDYERQCYRHAELIARNRLETLQDAVRGSGKIDARRSDSSSSNTGP